jgi:long-chain acyl-CoA synthetase
LAPECARSRRVFPPTFINQHPELSANSVEQAAKSELIQAEVAAAVARANLGLNSNEQIKKFAIVGLAWETGSEILTPTSKVKRRIVSELYPDVIEGLYAE